ncbi:hypothetical protein F8M41_003486 [Gigaspora margarita]|uniref:Uncharacterized protein n=1 Tax=Gigaspora margarita TaxID=4874 RepID=A0A8H3XC09_GIGMA|nr:hypothetical protein F8M41_003486 [Gigaspora margarita]
MVISPIFSMDEWAEITKENQLEDFQVPDELANFMNDYNKSTLQDIRSDIMRSYLKEEILPWQEYNMKTGILEICLDFCFRDSTLDTDIKRTEAPSLTSGNRKNRNKQKKPQKKDYNLLGYGEWEVRLQSLRRQITKNNLHLLGLNEDKENDFLKELKKGNRESTPPSKTIKYLADCWMTLILPKPIK